MADHLSTDKVYHINSTILNCFACKLGLTGGSQSTLKGDIYPPAGFQFQRYLHCHLQGHVWYCPWSHSERWRGWSPAFCALSEPKDRQADTQTSKRERKRQERKKKGRKVVIGRQRAAEKSRSAGSFSGQETKSSFALQFMEGILLLNS